MNETANARNRRFFFTALMVITAVSLVLRLAYVRLAIVDHPLRGDAVQYFSYAWNLIHHSTFSMALPNAPVVNPDSFRDPGYPAFLTFVAWTMGTGEGFYRAVLDVQCALSAFTVSTFIVLARRWLGLAPAIVVGCVLAVWPHLITQCGYILSETLLGALVGAALLLTDTALRLDRYGWYLAAGTAFVLAALTNAVILPFAPMLAVAMLLRHKPQRKFWLVFLCAATLPAGVWALRGATLTQTESSSDRAMMNLVQGAWPEYHSAYAAQLSGDSGGAATMQAIDAEYQAIHRDKQAGLSALVSRLAGAPMRSIGWYLSKPTHLWGWDIGIGQGDIYIFPTFNSPLLTQPMWRALTAALFLLNPIIMALAAVGAVAAVGNRRADVGLRVASLLGVFITAVFALLQSDARYATPYRGIEIVMAVYAVTLAIRWWTTRSGQNTAQSVDA